MKVEVTRDLRLSNEEVSLLSAHSFYNLVNVLVTDFHFLALAVESEPATRASLQACRELLESFKKRDKTLAEIDRADQYVALFQKDLNAVVDLAISNASFTPEKRKMVDAAVKNIENILAVFHHRIREALARREGADRWVFITLEEIKENLMEFLEATALNSKDRFGIVYNEAEQTKKDYYVGMDFRSADDNVGLHAPFSLLDTMRDLTANARKYTPIGGRIHIQLQSDPSLLTLSISDNGRGIPEKEIERVVEFGYRATNALPGETQGGGFGLTKAYFFCKSFGGTMWIDSKVEKGTTITLSIQRPLEEK